jgi:hypothetical protein
VPRPHAGLRRACSWRWPTAATHSQKRRKEEATATNTLKAVAEKYLAREGRNLRSLKNRKRVFERDIFPTLGALPIEAYSAQMSWSCWTRSRTSLARRRQTRP